MSTEAEARDMLQSLSILLPRVGEQWWWHPELAFENPRACLLVTVTEVLWNGEEWWIRSRPTSGDDVSYPNELSTWHQAATMHRPAPGEE